MTFAIPSYAYAVKVLASVFIYLTMAGSGIASEAVGEAHRIVNDVTGSGAAGNRQLASTDPVYRDEDVSAQINSRGELTLMDGSRLIVGENSTITLDDFVIAGDSFTKGTISVAKGAFRFISGRSKEALRITTPLATIGVRGTIADIYVRDNGVTDAVVLQGQLIVCTNAGICRLTQRTCDIIEVTSGSDIQRRPFLFSRERSYQEQADQYTLSENQQRHSGDWQAFMGGCSQRAAEEAFQRNDFGNTPDAAPQPTGPTPPSPPDDDDGPVID